MPVLRSGPHHTRFRPADRARQSLLERLGRAERVVDAVMLAVIGRPLVLPHARADLERLDHLGDARRGVGELVAVRSVLDLLPAGTQTEVEPPLAHAVAT